MDKIKDIEEMVIYRLQLGLELPVFICFKESDFHPNLRNVLMQCFFTKSSADKLKEKSEHGQSRVLIIKKASPRVAIQITMGLEGEYYGLESITPKSNYSLYRFKDQCLIIYSNKFDPWEMGALTSFADEKNEFKAKLIINRFIAWSTDQLGIVTFWGKVDENGAYVMNPMESQGDVFHVDINSGKLYFCENEYDFCSGFQLYRKDSTKKRMVRMNPEEAFSFLINRLSYFDPKGPSLTLKANIRTLLRMATVSVTPSGFLQPH